MACLASNYTVLYITIVLILQINCSCLNNQYYNASIGQCINCNSNCQTCSQSAENCTQCREGYFLQNNACVSCPNQCAACTSLSTCSACKAGYYLTGNLCSACGTNCDRCINSTACSVCSIGYDIFKGCSTCANQFYVNASLGKCDICQKGCLKCVEKSTCSQCMTNYRMTKSKTCEYLGKNKDDDDDHDDDEDDHEKQSSNRSVFVITAAVIGSIFGVACLICLAYSCRNQKNKKVSCDQSAASQKQKRQDIVQSQKQVEIATSNRYCSICLSGNAEIVLQCGHYCHKDCSSEANGCHLCNQGSQVDETDLNSNKSGSESDPCKEEIRLEPVKIKKQGSQQHIEDDLD